MTSDDYSQLDAGIRETVRFFHSMGYATCDSGDGVTKAELYATSDALGCPHVAIRVPRDELVVACHDIKEALVERGISVVPCGPSDPWNEVEIHGSYDPSTGQPEGMIVVVGLDDAMLSAHPEPENITRSAHPGECRLRVVSRDGIIIPENAPPPPHHWGKVAYETYAHSTGGKTFDGRAMPTWEALPDRIQQAWATAASAIRGAV